MAAWAATVAEATLGVALLAGFQARWSALTSGALSLTFAVSTGLFVHVTASLSASIFSAAAAGLLLAAAPGDASVWSADHLLRGTARYRRTIRRNALAHWFSQPRSAT